MVSGLKVDGGATPGVARPEAYTRVQVALHWTVVGLLIAQYSTSGAIVRTHSMHMIGQRQNPDDLLLHTLHNRLGLLLVVVMAGRLAYRLWAGAPAPVGHAQGAITARLAGMVHASFYAVLIAEGLTGAVASYFWWPISVAHVVLFKVLLGLVAIHVAAAMWHQLILGDTPLGRIGIKPFRRSPDRSSAAGVQEKSS